MNQNGLNILNQSEREIQLIIEHIKKGNNDVDIYKIINGLRNGVTPSDELMKLNQIYYQLDDAKKEYDSDNQSDDEAIFDYAPSFNRKRLLKISQELYEFIKYIKETYYTTHTPSHGIKVLDRKKKCSCKPKRKLIKKTCKKK